MKDLLHTLLALCGFISVMSCSQEKIEMYNGVKSGLILQQIARTDLYGNPTGYNDSVSYSFAGASDETHSLWARLIVSSIGNTTDYDRPYIIKVTPEGTTAIEGEDYDLSKNDFIIKARQAKDTINITLLRTNKLRNKTLRLKLQIEENDFFEIPIKAYKNTSSWKDDGPQNSGTSFIIKYDERYLPPSMWNMFVKNYLGTFTTSLYLELNKVMEWTKGDWDVMGAPGAKIQIGKLDYAARIFKAHLQEMADNGTPVPNDNGTYIQLPAPYQVDYSHIGSKQ